MKTTISEMTDSTEGHKDRLERVEKSLCQMQGTTNY